MKKSDEKVAMRVSFVTIVSNFLLSVIKFVAGIISNSSAMISDAIHTVSDVFSTFVVIIGVKISCKHSDDSHQYGHERMECIASILLSVVLFLTGLGIGYSGLLNIVSGNYDDLKVPGVLALIAAIVSILVKEWMYWYTIKAAKKIKSSSMKADAWHHRSDALSSIGALIGIIGARMGYPVLDSVASLIISLFIVKASIDIFVDATDKLVDKSCDKEVIDSMKEVVLKQEGVLGIDLIKTRIFGSRIYVDIEISSDGNLTLFEAHKIAENVHDSIEEEFGDVKHCMVHVNPMEK